MEKKIIINEDLQKQMEGRVHREKKLTIESDQKQNEPKDNKENNSIDPHRCEDNQYPGFPFTP